VGIAAVLAARVRDAIAPFGVVAVAVAVVAGSVPATSLCILAAVGIGMWSVGTLARMRCAHLLAEVALPSDEGERTQRIGILVLKL
jgi:hypothetical protein